MAGQGLRSHNVRNIHSPLALGAALAIVSCGSPDGGSNNLQARDGAQDGAVSLVAAQSGSIAENAVLALADHLDVPVTTISVESLEAVDWPDSSVGCPQPGQAYLQVITPGHRISLRHEGKLYVMHEANGRAFICVRRKPVESTQTTTVDLVWAEQAMLAREDLAARLNVDAAEISVSSARAATWTDTSLGCADPQKTYEDLPTEGYVLMLRHGSRNYRYHTDLDRVVACAESSED
jgi:hypothetical protein